MVYVHTYVHTVGTGVTEGAPNGKIGGGWTLAPLREGAKRYYVNNLHGSATDTANTGEDHTVPLLTPEVGVSKVRPEMGDQLLIAEGTTYDIGAHGDNIFAEKKGHSAAYPTCVRSYDPADPTNEDLIGRADPADQPVLYSTNGLFKWTPSLVVNGSDYFLHQGITFRNDSDTVGTSVGPWAKSDKQHWENCGFASIGVYGGGDSDTGVFANDHTSRFCVSSGAWAMGGAAGNMFITHVNGLIAEYNINHHGGWKIGLDRTVASSEGGPHTGSQGYYFKAYNTHCVRHCVSLETSAAGLSVRGDAIPDMPFKANVSIRDPIGVASGGCSDSAEVENPDGVSQVWDEFFMIGACDVSPSAPRRVGFIINNAVLTTVDRGYFLHTNTALYGDSSYVSVESSTGLGSSGGSGTQLIETTGAVNNCVGQAFSSLLRGPPTTYAEVMHLSWANCRFADPITFGPRDDGQPDLTEETFGEGNLTGATALATFPEPYADETAFYVSQGHASYEDYRDYLLANPAQPHAERVFLDAAPRYGLTTEFSAPRRNRKRSALLAMAA